MTFPSTREMLRQLPRALRPAQSIARFSQKSVNRQKVQTPIQTQNKDKIVHPQFQPAEGTQVQTPMQSQNPTEVAPRATKTQSRDLLPYYTLFGGLLGGSIFVYYYYEYRKAHMQKKWENMLREAQEKRNGNG